MLTYLLQPLGDSNLPESRFPLSGAPSRSAVKLVNSDLVSIKLFSSESCLS